MSLTHSLRRAAAACVAAAAGLGGVLPAGAAVVDVAAPGGLADAVAALPAATTELTITGRAYAGELSLLRDALPELTRLDLSGLSLSPAAIPPYAFAATRLTAVALPADVAVIGEGAFAALPAAEVALPASLDSIAPYAFAHSSLTAVALPERLRTVGRSAFGGCTALAAVSGGTGVATLGESAFHGIAATSLDLAEWRSLRSVGAKAFEGCTALASVALPANSGLAVGEGAFMGCTALAELHGGALDEVPPLMLADAPHAPLDEVVADGTRTIGGYALSGNLTARAVLPATVDSIGDHAMERMTALYAIDASALGEVPALGSEVWHGIDQSQVTLETSDNMGAAFAAAAQWQEFKISRTTGASGIDDDAGNDVEMHFEGTWLVVNAARTIATVEAVTLDGIALARTAPGAAEARLDASRWPGRVVVVAVALDNGARATFTLTR